MTAKSRAAVLSVAIVVAARVLSAVAEQSSPALQITAPAAGTVVSPGQAISVTVAGVTGASFRTVAVVGESPIGSSMIATAVPAQFSLAIPANIASGRYELTATGRTTSGQHAESEPVEIDVERSDRPASIATLMPDLTFEVPGETVPIILQAFFRDGSVVDVRRSSRVAYTSSDIAVASVDAGGVTTAVAPGRATVTAVYSQGGQSVRTTVSIIVPSPALRPSRYALSFGDQAIGTTGGTRSMTLTNTTNGPVTIISITTEGEFSQTNDCPAAAPMLPGTSCSVALRFAPADRGLRKGALTIASTANGKANIIALTGTGTGGLDVTPAVTHGAS